MQDTPFEFLVGKIPWRRGKLPMPVFLGFPGGSEDTESARSSGDLVLIPGLGRSGGGHGNPFQFSCLENPHGQSSFCKLVVGRINRCLIRLGACLAHS